MNIADKITENLVMDGITTSTAGEESSKIQSDWNQNDSTKPDYIKNRIGYDNSKILFSFDKNLIDTYEKSEITIQGQTISLYKISDKFYNKDEVVGYNMFFEDRSEKIDDSNILLATPDDGTFLIPAAILARNPRKYTFTVGTTEISWDAPSAGVWWLYGVTSYVGTNEIIKIQPQYLPVPLKRLEGTVGSLKDQISEWNTYKNVLLYKDNIVKEISTNSITVNQGVDITYHLSSDPDEDIERYDSRFIDSIDMFQIRMMDNDIVNPIGDAVVAVLGATQDTLNCTFIHPNNITRSTCIVTSYNNITIPNFNPDTDKGKVLGIDDDGNIAWITK